MAWDPTTSNAIAPGSKLGGEVGAAAALAELEELKLAAVTAPELDELELDDVAALEPAALDAQLTFGVAPGAAELAGLAATVLAAAVATTAAGFGPVWTGGPVRTGGPAGLSRRSGMLHTFSSSFDGIHWWL